MNRIGTVSWKITSGLNEFYSNETIPLSPIMLLQITNI